ncbi:hypothetical protein GBA52_013676 [Prunus armeniaca]|nr:hypothetical protein GBA52_013676 [Prunus armeniaca]
MAELPWLDDWICTAITHNVVELDVDLARDSFSSEPVELPRSLYMCKTLVVLKLKLPSIITFAPHSDCFPSLKFLHVNVACPDAADSMGKLFTCCPVLEDLTIEAEPDGGSVLNVNISAPQLKRLRMNVFLCIVGEYYDYKTFINANTPNLEKFSFDGNVLAVFSSKNAKSLKIAKNNFEGLHAGSDAAELLHRHFAGIGNVEYLGVSAPIFGSPNMVSDRCAGFVDRVLALGGSSYIHRLRLECANIEDYFSRIDAWICTAISRKVVELDLCLLSYSCQSSFELPRSLFMCDTLEVLRLRVKSNLITKPPTSNCFPSLKFMHVTLYRPFYDPTLYRTFYDSTRNLFSCCPVLEDLIIDGFVHHKPAFLFNVFAPKLKRLEINLYVILDRKSNHPNGWNLEDKFWKNAESLSKAKIALRVPPTGYPGDIYLWQLLHYADQLSKLLAGINKVTYLSFSAPISEVSRL